MSTSKAPEVLQDLHDHTADLLRSEAAMDDTTSKRIARLLVDRMRYLWGGQPVYFAKGLALDITERDREMWERFDGSNHADIAREFRVTLQTVYNRLRAVRVAKIAETQRDLFDDTPHDN